MVMRKGTVRSFALKIYCTASLTMIPHIKFCATVQFVGELKYAWVRESYFSHDSGQVLRQDLSQDLCQ